MKADYRLLSTQNGVTYFAKVYVESNKTASANVNIYDLIDKNNYNTGEVDSIIKPTWVKAAIEGALDAANKIKSLGLLNNGCNIHIKKIIGSLVDTQEDSIRCASAIATWKSLCPDIPHPKPSLVDGFWVLA